MNSGKQINKIITLIIFVNIIIFTFLIYPVLFSTPALNTNLIANPSFESGSMKPLNWTFVTNDGNTPIWDNVNHSGTKSIKISIMVTKGMESGYARSDLIRAESEKNYTFTAWVKTGSDKNYGSAVRVVELDSNMNYLQQTNLIIDKDTNGWMQKSIDFQTNSNTMYFYIYANIWKAYGTFWVDDVSLSLTNPAPTPTPVLSSVHEPAPTTGSTYYVSPDGYDGNYGSFSSPWRTIQHAADVSSAGDTVYVMGGNYNEKITITKSGSPGNYITFAPYPRQNATIDGTGISLDMWEGLVRILGASYINISGFRIINSKFMGIMVTSDYLTNFSTNIIIEKNLISNIASSAILIEDGKEITIDGNEITKAQTMEGLSQHIHETISLVNVDGFEIKNNKLYQNNFESIDAKEGTSNGNIHHNDISQHQSAGIYLDSWSGASHDIEVFSNRIFDGRASGRGIALAVENGGSLKNIKVYNNLIYHNAATGIDISWYSNGIVDNISITDNTIYNNGLIDSWGGGISVDYDLATDVIIRNNIVSKNKYVSLRIKNADTQVENNLIDDYLGGQYESKGVNFIERDPQFVDPTNEDFHLKSTSPAIDRGSSTSTVDFDGKSRPSGGGYDIGAFEYSP